MSMLASSAPSVARDAYPISVEAYHAMIADGTLDEDDPVELIEGELLFKMSKSKPHIRTTNRLNGWLTRTLPVEWTVQGQDPVTFSQSEPEPDAACVTQASMDRPTEKAGPGDIALIVEVSDSTLGYDRTKKLRIYARAGIPEYWIINLVDRQIEVYTQPDDSGPEPRYLSRVVRSIGDTIALPATLGGATIAVADLLPPM